MNARILITTSFLTILGIGIAAVLYVVRPFPFKSLTQELSAKVTEQSEEQQIMQQSISQPDIAPIDTQKLAVPQEHDIQSEKIQKAPAPLQNLKRGDISLKFTSQLQELEQVPLQVHGKIPEWLSGNLLRTGPALFESKQGTAPQWFDGCAMIYQFNVDKGRVSYSNRFLQTDYLDQVKIEGRFGMKKEASSGLFGRLGALMATDVKPTYDNGNNNICLIGDCVCALTETPLHTCFDPVTLQQHKRFSFDDALDCHYSCAHPQIDPATGDLYNYAIKFGNTSTYIVYKVPADTKKRVVLSEIKVSYPSYMHSFALTNNYLILIETPLRVNPVDFIMQDKPFLETYTWHAKQNCKLIVLDKKTGKTVGTYATDSFFYMHQLNAYENDDSIILDIAAYENPQIIYSFAIDNHKAKKSQLHAKARPTRVAINVKTGATTQKIMTQESIETPHINYEDYAGKPYTFTYGTHITSTSDITNALIKLNVINGKTLIWHEDDCYPGEPIFVARPEGSTEDDGVLLAVTLNLKTSTSLLLILDAKTMKELARAQIPHHIPLDSHGIFTL